jgi:GDP-L-fucose synthase
MIRKIHLAKCLYNDDWDAVRLDLNKRPVEGFSGDAPKETIRTVLNKYGITDRDVTLWGTGRPLREFLWSEEMAESCVFIMENVDFKDLKGDALETRNCHINIGTGKDISIKDLAALIRMKVEYGGKVSFDAAKPDGTMRKLTDVSKLHALGWHHKIEIDEGVEKIYRWYVSGYG